MPIKRPHLKCGLSELDYSNHKVIQEDIDHSYLVELTPKNSILPQNPLVFAIESGTDFVDLAKTVLKLTLSMSDEAGDPVTAEDKVGPINNFANSLFSQIAVSLKDTTITQPNPNYAYRAYFDNLLNYNSDAKNTWLKFEGFYQDTAGLFDDATNAGLLARKALFLDGAKVHLTTRLHTDINFQKNLIPSNLDIRYVLTPARQQFVVQNFTDAKVFKIKIESAKLIVRKVKLNPSRALAFEREIAKDELRLALPRVKMYTHTLSAGIKSFEKDAFFSGRLPEYCVFGFVKNSSYTGTYAENPFKFGNYSISNIQGTINGRAIPNTGINLDFENSDLYDGFMSLYSVLGKEYYDVSNGLSFKDYSQGCSLFAINFTSDSSCPHDNTSEIGNIDICVKFSTALPHSITMIIYAFDESCIVIDKYRNIITEN